MRRALLLTICSALVLGLPATPAAAALSSYRGITLGDSVQVVADHLKIPVTDVKVVHERPTVVQSITWRPRRFVSGAGAERDPLAEMVLTFNLGRLARIEVIYDRDRTQGLTNADLVEALTAVYGPSLLLSTPTGTTTSAVSELETIGSWMDPETLVLLWRERYPSRVGLTLTSIDGDRALQDAISGGARLQASEAPARELAIRAAEAAAIQARDEKLRRDNKAAFKP